jgi:hypothetical protein
MEIMDTKGEEALKAIPDLIISLGLLKWGQ